MTRIDKPHKKPPDAYVKKAHANIGACLVDAKKLVKEIEAMKAEMQTILDEHKDRVITLVRTGTLTESKDTTGGKP